MDEHFRKRALWVGLGAAALILTCLLFMAGAAFVLFGAARGAPVYVQPPAAGEGAVQPPVAAYGPGPLGGLFYGVRALFKLAFLGLGLLLLFGLVRRMFWGPRHWWPHCYAPFPPGKGGEGRPGGGQPHGHWRRHWHHPWYPPPWWEPEAEGAAGQGQAPGEPEAGEPATGYSGPQE